MTDRKIDRRTFIKGAGISSAAVATGATSTALDANPVGRAQAVAPIPIGGYIAASMVVGAVANHFMGEDTGQLDGSEETADLHAALFARITELKAANDSVLTATSNRLEDSRNVVWPSVKYEAVKSFNAGDSESAVTTAATDAVDAHYATIQKNILNRGTEWINSVNNIMDLHQTDSGLSSSPVIRISGDFHNASTGGTVESSTFPADLSIQQQSVTLADSTSHTYNRIRGTGDLGDSVTRYMYLGPLGAGGSTSDPDVTLSGITAVEIDAVGSNPVLTWSDYAKWSSLWASVQDAHSQMVSNAEQFVISLTNNYSPGDLDHTQWMDASTLASELSTSYESTGHNAYAAAEAAMLGIPGSTKQSMVVRLEETGLEFSGSLWTDWAPASSSSSGSTSTATATATPTGSDSDSPSIAGESAFAVGETYDPSLTPKTVFLSYEYGGPEYIKRSDVFTKDGDGGWTKTDISSQSGYTEAYNSGSPKQVGFTKLQQPFTIVEAYNAKTGNEVETVNTESKNHQTSDVGVTQEQMQQLLELQKEIRENEQAGGGAGFGFGGLGSLPFGGVGAGAVGIGALALAALSQLTPRPRR